MTIWIRESETIIQAAVIKIPESVPDAVDATAENCFESGSGWFVKVISNESGAVSFGPCSIFGLNRKSCKIAEATYEPQAPGPDWEVAFSKITVSYE